MAVCRHQMTNRVAMAMALSMAMAMPVARGNGLNGGGWRRGVAGCV